MRDRPNRNISSEDCRCCIITCSPCLGLWLTVEYILRGICCCPCYMDIFCEKKKKTINPIPNPAIEIPVALPVAESIIPVEKDIIDKYNGKIWGWNISN